MFGVSLESGDHQKHDWLVGAQLNAASGFIEWPFVQEWWHTRAVLAFRRLMQAKLEGQPLLRSKISSLKKIK